MKAMATQSSIELPSLGWWNLYFIIKIILFSQGTIDFHFIENLSLAAFLLLPIQNQFINTARNIVAIPLALLLMHYDSYLPPIDRLFAQADQILSFEFSYILELIGRFISLQDIMLGIALAVGYYFVAKVFRVSVFVMLAIGYCGIVTLTQNNISTEELANTGRATARGAVAPTQINDSSLNSYLDDFFAAESSRKTSFAAPNINAAPFDVLMLSICSLGNDDLKLTGLNKHPLFNKFDVVFDQFNSATSYSGPAIIRLSRANCGQAQHSSLYGPANRECQLFEQLADQGFAKQLAMNHDGVFDAFLEKTQLYSGISSAPLSQAGVRINQKDFTGGAIYSDLGMLKKWWQTRLNSQTPRVAALYNSTSLHDGNRIIDNPASGLESYKIRTKTLLDDLSQFITELENSNRNIVIVLIPEHGAGLRGDKMQISGMRELPSPLITQIPVAVKLIGPGLVRNDGVAYVRQPSSHQALAEVLNNILTQQVYEEKTFSSAELTRNLPRTEMVSQNQGSTVIEVDHQHYISLDNSSWTTYQSD
jgi:cellulose synthase operon protein YhjU